ncbi:MAG: hypothetical protein J5I41_12355 [Saprospiraceae bacterium]|nr:hypothetical protein [Saprospiraceae bacterium]
MNRDLFNLQRKVENYKQVLANTAAYRQVWHDSLRQEITEQLLRISEMAGLTGEVEEREELRNLGAIVYSLGDEKSGMTREVAGNIHRDLIKHNGSLIYQQLFNGKILVLINYPYIESYGQPAPPKTIGIYRPEELKPPFFLRHLETFVQEITYWEDYDDDDNGNAQSSQRIGFKMNFETQPEP